MLSAAKHLCAERDRPFAEFTLSATNVLRVTRFYCSNGQVQFVKIEPCLKWHNRTCAGYLAINFSKHEICAAQNSNDITYLMSTKYFGDDL